jgi:hypothetical protein
VKNQHDSSNQRIKTIYLGAFLVDGQVDYGAIGSNNLQLLTSDLPSGFSYTSSPKEFVEDSPLLIGDHRIRSGKRDVTEPILDISLSGEFAPRMLISPLGTGLVIVESETAYDTRFERILTDSLALPIRTIAEWVPEAFPELMREVRPKFLLPGAQLLWWHRVVPLSSAGGMRADTWGSRTTKNQENLELTVGDGFTWVADELLDENLSRQSVVRGLSAAMDDWIIADTTNKQLREYVESLEIAMSEADYSKIQRVNQEGETLTQQGQFLRLFMDERDRNLVVLDGEVWTCARKAWGLTGELSNLDTKISLIHNQATLATNRLQQNRDSFRNWVLFAIAVLTALQGLLFVVDFAVNPELSVRHPLRGSISLALFLAALGVCIEVARRWFVEGRNSRARRRTRRKN